MKRLILICALASSLSACAANTNPARSSCFANGKATCEFKPLPVLWAEKQ